MSRSSLEINPSQTAKIVEFLRSRRGAWVPLPEILGLRISQYSARIFEARHKWGLNIENRTEVVNGKKHSWFRLAEKPAIERQPAISNPGLFSSQELERSARWEDQG
jgi:hypothetical protein